MKESIIITILIIIIYIFLIGNKSNLKMIHTKDTLVYVREMDDSITSGLLLTELVDRMYILRDNMVSNKNKYPLYIEYIELMERNFNKKRTRIYENNIDSNNTSYSVNKGEEIVFCLRCKKTHKLHSINILVYVAVHEMAHTACPEIDHTPLFYKIFKFLLTNAIKLNIYIYEDYNNNPIIYCGMNLHSNILN